MFGQWVTNKV